MCVLVTNVTKLFYFKVTLVNRAYYIWKIQMQNERNMGLRASIASKLYYRKHFNVFFFNQWQRIQNLAYKGLVSFATRVLFAKTNYSIKIEHSFNTKIKEVTYFAIYIKTKYESQRP